MSKHYIIGDVHGMYHTLLSLLNKLPADANTIFVGDLIDRGNDSAKVVKLLRQRGYQSVLGNHENTFIRFFDDYFAAMPWSDLKRKWEIWLYNNGGKETLQSYQMWDNPNPSVKILEQIKSDYEWMKNLPIYIELKAKHKSNLPVVVSHSNLTKVWHLRDFPDAFETFKECATRTRDLAYEPKSGIVNIFGHTPIQEYDTNSYTINVDSGCCYGDEHFAKLTAYGVEENRFVVQERVKEDLKQ